LEEFRRPFKPKLEQKIHAPGAGVGMVSHGELLWCIGIALAAVLPKKDLMRQEFSVGSISKSFVARRC